VNANGAERNFNHQYPRNFRKRKRARRTTSLPKSFKFEMVSARLVR